MDKLSAETWGHDWIWGLPLIALTVVIHVIGLGLIVYQVGHFLTCRTDSRRFTSLFAVIMGLTAILAAMLHGLEGLVWAEAYRLLGALPGHKSAMLYSLSAMTTYGHANLVLEARWQMMGALEAVDGMLLFGLTTAFMFAMIQRV